MKPGGTNIEEHEVDRSATVLKVVELVKQYFPTATEDPSEFLKINKNFIESLCSVPNISQELSRYCESACPVCKKELQNWHHKTKESYFLSLAEVKKIQVTPKFCASCKLLVYYNLYSVGCIPIHNKVIMTF